nr:AAC(3)-I family aminoglycoside N-acetyltransferase [Sphingomonas sp. OV641]
MQHSSEPVIVRRLGPADLDAMRRLNLLFHAAFDHAADYVAAPPDDRYLAAQLARPHVFALVAEQGAMIVGGLVAYLLDKLERARAEAYIYDLAVAESHRRRGVATALIDALRPLVRDAGGYVIFVQADYGDDPAVALYTKLGTREDVMHFDIAVEDETRTTPGVATGSGRD